MSGGVDSSVAAALLVEQGYEVIGATMQVWDYTSCDITEGSGTCCSSLDVDDARSVADKLNIPFYVLNCEAKFKASVIDPFIKAYLNAQTPLPCVNCNTYLKFDHLIKKMKELDCDYLSTGHYAQIVTNEKGQAQIKTSTDDWKDQTYFLFTIDPEIVPKLLFPIGHLKKPQVREIAEAKGLVVAKKKDSTGICFVGAKGYEQFIKENVAADILASKKGQIKRFPSGEVMGAHEGIHLYTIGQGKGLGMTYHEKLFVISIKAEDNSVWVGEEKYLLKDEVNIIEPQWLTEIEEGAEYQVKIRYQHQGSAAVISKTENGYKLKFKEAQRAVTPGQAAVLYKNQQLVGGGWITLN
ncbi:MAG: tRNA 2-thiouridine(34) synthase MnmA [Bdellovibrionaceae bacterium]|nr:tRNA 2-thiouridine(34) synthase MnmA [Bdellovibrio sp.]